MTLHWVIDRRLDRSDPLGNRLNERGYEDLIEALARTETPHTFVKSIPFVGTLVDPDDSSKEVTLDIDGPVYITGTMSMRRAAALYDWTPGYVDAPGQTELIDAWGEHVLNHDAVIAPFATAVPPASEFFARPVEDSKSFAGELFLSEEGKSGRDQFESWRRDVMGLETSSSTIQPDDLILLAPLKNIYAEYRLYVVGGVIITGSLYKRGQVVHYDRNVDPSVLDFARERLREYCPRDALCLDIAYVEGPEPYKVIETNSISSSGFYACDMNLFVNAMNAQFG